MPLAQGACARDKGPVKVPKRTKKKENNAKTVGTQENLLKMSQRGMTSKIAAQNQCTGFRISKGETIKKMTQTWF